MNWLNILLYIPHCCYGVPRRLAVSTAKVMAKSLPSRNHLYNALFYLNHCDVSVFQKAKSPNSSYAALLALFSSFLKLAYRIGTAQGCASNFIALLSTISFLCRVQAHSF